MSDQLLGVLSKLAQLQKQPLDRQALTALVREKAEVQSPQEAFQTLSDIALQMQWPVPKRWGKASRVGMTDLPCPVWSAAKGWGVLRGKTAQGQWLTEWLTAQPSQWQEEALVGLEDMFACRLDLAKPYSAINSSVYQLIVGIVLRNKSTLFEIALAGVMINLIALATSLFSMQVYDRVVPTGALGTLWALTLGVILAIFFELLIKWSKSSVQEKLVDLVDSEISRAVYTRFMAIRLDQMPSHVGALASQLRGYETVRGFLVSIPVQLLIDTPFVLLYCLVVFGLAGWVGWIPCIFFVLSALLGLLSKSKIEALTQKNNAQANLKTGMLVETVEGAETIKSGQGGWRMLMRWMMATDEARTTELEMRHLQERSQYLIATLHQLSYASMVAAGAISISSGSLTMGALIACTILSGRILGPIGSLPNMLIQWGHTRAALKSLDHLWALETDHHGVSQPVVLDRIDGLYEFEDVQAQYGMNKALVLSKFAVRPGEKVAIMGPVGAGKTTLLRLLSGMYKPQAGRVKLDGVDIAHIAKPVLAEQIGYLQQEGRLFAGTLRENLVLGLVDPGDQVLLDLAKRTGLFQSVINVHPLGLMRPIFEGGMGLSGGQRQLTNLTRVFLRNPRIWLLDEPTASLDKQLELWVLQALRQTLRPQDTLVVVTHKPELLALVDRLVVVANHQVVMDGPRDEVLKRLQTPATPIQPSSTAQTPQGASASSGGTRALGASK
jgi:ATP-binding cassette, subfamily C, bacterial LapB